MKKRNIYIGIIIILLILYFGVKIYATKIAKEKVDKVIASISNSVNIDYKKISVDVLGLDVHIKKLNLQSLNSNKKIKIDEVIIYEIDKKSNIPNHLDIYLKKIQIPLSQMDYNTKKFFMNLGYSENLYYNTRIKYYYDLKDKELDLENIKIGAEDIGDITLKLKLGNINLTQNPFNLLLTYPQIIIYEGKLSYEDDGLFERLFKAKAKEKNISVKKYKENIILEIEKEIENEKGKFVKKAYKKLKDFIEDPDEISIIVKPKKPINIGRLLRIYNPKYLVKKLNLEID